LYGDAINRDFGVLYMSIGGRRGLADLAKARGFTEELQGYAASLSNSDFTDEERTRIVMEELLSHIAQAPKFGDRVKAIVGKIRAWLRDKGFVSLAKFGETDLLNILSKASKAHLVLTAHFMDNSDEQALKNKIERGELVLIYKGREVLGISGLAEKKMPQFSSHLAHGLLHARAAVSNETVAPGLPNARAIGTGAKLKILREPDMGKREQGKALGRRDACSTSSSLRRDSRRRQQHL
jgi:hypothetical protein